MNCEGVELNSVSNPSFDLSRRQPDSAKTSSRLIQHADMEAAKAEALALAPAAWQTHFNNAYHNGGWQAIALRESRLAAINIAPGEHALESFHDNALLASCPAIAQLIAHIPCSKKSIRLLRLNVGGIIHEHVDAGVTLASGEARLHFVLQTDENTHFFVDQKRVPMRAGECWFVDVSRPHRVANQGVNDRIHLVIDCVVDARLLAWIAAGDGGEAYPEEASPQAMFERFKNMVFADDSLQYRLLATPDRKAFIEETVLAGSEHGLHFTEDEIVCAINHGRRAWFEQWIM